MSSTPLSITQLMIERTAFEAIRQECVDKGYLPDVSNTTLYPDSEAGYQAFQTDLKAIAEGPKGFAIEVFSNQSPRELAEKQVPRITIISGEFLGGAIGADGTPEYQDIGNGQFQKILRPPQTSNYYIDVLLTSNSATQDRILHAILSLALPKRRYVPFYDGQPYNFFFNQVNGVPREIGEDDLIEKRYTYEIPDVYEIEPTTLPGTISAMTEIKVYPIVVNSSGNEKFTDSIDKNV